MTLLIVFLFTLSASPDDAPVALIAWENFYSSIRAEGMTYSEQMRSLEGKRVRLRGHAVAQPHIDGGLFLTRFEHHDPDGVEERDLPFDAVAIIWRMGIDLPPVPRRPTVEGVLRLGNRRAGEEVVTVTLDDAIPVIR